MGSKIAKDQVVDIHYTLRGEDKQIIDSSSGKEPLSYLHGYGQLIPGLEGALLGKGAGEKISVTVEAKDGYGERDEGLIAVLERKLFPPDAPLKVGAMFQLSNSAGSPIVVRVIELDDTNVTVDGNHELAGKRLFFDVEVVSLRAATAEELDHGHAHPGDGHHHHE